MTTTTTTTTTTAIRTTNNSTETKLVPQGDPTTNRHPTEERKNIEKQEEEDIEKNVIALKNDFVEYDDYGNKLRISIWDHGGQEVFRSVQHLYLPRQSCYVVVFNLIDVFDKDKRGKALEHLYYWLHAIKYHACSNEKDQQQKDIERKQNPPPVVLVGTHYDELLLGNNSCDESKNQETTLTCLREINQVLVDHFALLQLFPVSPSPTLLLRSPITI